MTVPVDDAGAQDLSAVSWQTSSYSQSGGECVQAAFLPDGGVALRHSNDPDGSVLIYTRGEWHAFLKGAKDGEFDLT
ncbi:MAG: hypothetical protein QOJ29_108 [Thermoleophilaceae bacterium]|jgi:hypothetical protein|nr:hypothetical protein [Thermoleophilaceae bacterium]